MPVFTLPRRIGSVGCEVSKVARNINYLIKCVDSLASRGDVEGLKSVIKSLAIYAEHGDTSKLLTALGYSFTLNESVALKAAMEALVSSNVPLNKLINALAAIIGMERFIVLSIKYGLLNDDVVNAILDKLGCLELATLTEGISNLELSTETVINVISRALSVSFCREAKYAALKAMASLMNRGKIKPKDVIDLLKRLGMKLIIVKNRRGEIKELRLILRNEEGIAANDAVLQFVSNVLKVTV